MRLEFGAVVFLIAVALAAPAHEVATYTIEEAVALAQAQNPEIAIARKKVQAARGGFVEARSGFLPSVASTGFYDKRQQQTETRLRDEDYNAILRVEQNLYTGGAVTSQVAIARLNIEKQGYEFQEVADRVTMDVRIAFTNFFSNLVKTRGGRIPLAALKEELRARKERCKAG